MKNLRNVSMIIIGVVLFALLDAFSQPKTHQPGASGIDSTQNYCREVFLKNCSGCHGEKGQGSVGPNLTDKYWLHGGGAKNINNTIRDGVAGKGMICWNAVFSAQEIQQIADCVLSLQGTNPPHAKKPEGELFEDGKVRQKDTKEKQ